MRNIYGWLALGCSLLAACAPSDAPEELSGGYYLRDEGPGAVEIMSHDTAHASIWGEIYGYDYNRDFIIAFQHPAYEDYQAMVMLQVAKDSVRFPDHGKGMQKEIAHVADSILFAVPFYKQVLSQQTNYWIIEHKTHTVYGPLTKVAFVEKSKELKVPASLHLDDK